MDAADLATRLERVERLYGGELPDYLEIRDTDTLVIRAAPYEGAPVQEVTISPRDVVTYYRQDNPRGCAGMSGCRTLATFTTDWRTVDAMAREAMAIYRVLNREALEQEGSRYGMRLRDGP